MTADRGSKGATFLLVSANGGFTHAAPVLELGRILAARGYRVEFATHVGQERWVHNKPEYDFLSAVHLMGAGMTPEEEATHYTGLQATDLRKDFAAYLKPLYKIESFWTSDYSHLTKIVKDKKPDMIVADFFVANAVRDINIQIGTPIAMVWPQMPYGMVAAQHIPGFPGFQTDALTGENATMWMRLRAELRMLRSATSILPFFNYIKNMRRDAGINYSLKMLNKPDHLVLVNSFWGLETPRDLPPLVAPIGPILSEEYAPLDSALEQFHGTHSRVIYVAFGTHVNVPTPDLEKFLVALSTLKTEGLIDGVVWAASASQRSLFDRAFQPPGSTYVTGEILDNKTADWVFTPFAPQRAVLARPETLVFITHGGGSSVNESFLHATPMLVLGFFADQTLNALRVTEAGCGSSLDKAEFSAEEVYAKTRGILLDETGTIANDVQRMRHIAAVASRRKEHGVDLIEEVLYDARYSTAPPGVAVQKYGKGRRRPMHLQTADVRMPLWKLYNWDLKVLGFLSVGSVLGAGYWAVRFARGRQWPW